MRVAVVDDATGLPLNDYKDTVSVRGAEPVLPYAMYLADAGRFRLLAFDLDATHTSPTVVLEDLAQLRTWLNAAGIPHLVAASGPGGGRHVWAAIAGAGAELHADAWPGLDRRPGRYPDPVALVGLARERVESGAPADPLTPLYLRRPDAVVPGAPKAVRQ